MVEAPAGGDKLIGEALGAIRTCERTHVSEVFFQRQLNVTFRVAAEVIQALAARELLGQRGRAGYPVLGECAPGGAAAAPADRVALPGAQTLQSGARVRAVASTSVREPYGVPPAASRASPHVRPTRDVASEVPTDAPRGHATPAPSGAVVRDVRLRELELDPTVQPREALDDHKVEEYAERMAEGYSFPQVTVFQEGKLLRLVDGFHRVAAAERAGVGLVSARIQPGTKRDAILAALRANLAHGLPLCAADKRAAARRLLADPEWNQWSDQEIAKHCGFTGMTIGRIRAEMEGCDLNNVKGKSRHYQRSDGSVGTMNVAGLGRKARRGPSDTKPAAPGGAASDVSATATLAAESGETRPLVDELLDAVENLLAAEDPAAEWSQAGPDERERLRRGLDALADLLRDDTE